MRSTCYAICLLRNEKACRKYVGICSVLFCMSSVAAMIFPLQFRLRLFSKVQVPLRRNRPIIDIKMNSERGFLGQPVLKNCVESELALGRFTEIHQIWTFREK